MLSRERREMQRVLVIGPCGAGKSTFARALAERTGLPVYHMDRLHWKPGWVESSDEELTARLEPILAGDQWIIDGNYFKTLSPRTGQADTLIFLDLPPRIYRWRVIKRMVTGYGRSRADMTEGCPERLDIEFLRYVWHFHRDSRPQILTRLDDVHPNQRVYTLRHPREVRAFLDAAGESPATR